MRATIVLFTFTLMAPLAHADAAGDIASFNRSLDDAIRRMSNAAVLALWDDDGVSLLPKTPPIVGKAAIGRFLDETTKQFPDGKVTTQKTDCFDVRVAGDWASEWCRAHQVADLGGGKRFDGWGKLLFVLHKGADGKWRIHEEMWNEDAPPK